MADRFVKTSYDAETATISWSFPTDSTLSPVTLSVRECTPAVRERAEVHGFIQTCSDPAAGKKTAAEKRAAIADRAEWLQLATEWAKERTHVAPKFDGGAVVTALARVKFAGDIEKTNGAVDRLAAKRAVGRDEALKLFAADGEIAAELARMKAAAKPAAVDADDLIVEASA